MKRKEFIRQFEKKGCILLRHGARHDIYLNPSLGKKQPIPRHHEIDDISETYRKAFRIIIT
ncbi:MAG: type II toxin-antitoxin system HicA family toxin [Thermodesulfobacteriota bacterium]